jgi:hypothetical protein
MHPIKHGSSNLVYRGPTPNIGDLWVERVDPHHVRVVYDLTDNDRALIAEGGRIELAMYHEPIPPISMGVLPERMCRPVGEHGWKGQELDKPQPRPEPDGGRTFG